MKSKPPSSDASWPCPPLLLLLLLPPLLVPPLLLVLLPLLGPPLPLVPLDPPELEAEPPSTAPGTFVVELHAARARKRKRPADRMPPRTRASLRIFLEGGAAAPRVAETWRARRATLRFSNDYAHKSCCIPFRGRSPGRRLQRRAGFRAIWRHLRRRRVLLVGELRERLERRQLGDERRLVERRRREHLEQQRRERVERQQHEQREQQLLELHRRHEHAVHARPRMPGRDLQLEAQRLRGAGPDRRAL